MYFIKWIATSTGSFMDTPGPQSRDGPSWTFIVVLGPQRRAGLSWEVFQNYIKYCSYCWIFCLLTEIYNFGHQIWKQNLVFYRERTMWFPKIAFRKYTRLPITSTYQFQLPKALLRSLYFIQSTFQVLNSPSTV